MYDTGKVAIVELPTSENASTSHAVVQRNEKPYHLLGIRLFYQLKLYSAFRILPKWMNLSHMW